MFLNKVKLSTENLLVYLHPEIDLSSFSHLILVPRVCVTAAKPSCVETDVNR